MSCLQELDNLTTNYFQVLSVKYCQLSTIIYDSTLYESASKLQIFQTFLNNELYTTSINSIHYLFGINIYNVHPQYTAAWRVEYLIEKSMLLQCKNYIIIIKINMYIIIWRKSPPTLFLYNSFRLLLNIMTI
jgi:hypothetical protein